MIFEAFCEGNEVGKRLARVITSLQQTGENRLEESKIIIDFLNDRITALFYFLNFW